MFTRLTNATHGSQSSGKIRLHTLDRDQSEPPSEGKRVETNVLGSIQG